MSDVRLIGSCWAVQKVKLEQTAAQGQVGRMYLLVSVREVVESDESFVIMGWPAPLAAIR